ncbi:hypothetical protein R50072_28090 [Simiduia litorea]
MTKKESPELTAMANNTGFDFRSYNASATKIVRSTETKYQDRPKEKATLLQSGTPFV